jgi:site-specific DNA-methyltransferase (adenine-specific)
MKLPKPYFEADGITLYHGDAMVLAPLIGERFDAAITDPPYGETALDWDHWPKGWPEMARTMTDSLWCFGSFRMFFDQRNEFLKWQLAQDIIWEKQNGSGLHSDRFRRVHEMAAHFYNGSWSGIYKQPVFVPVIGGRKKSVVRKNKPTHFNGISNGAYEYGDQRIMRSVIFTPNCHRSAINETQKPEELVAPLITYSVPPGGSLVDFFCGSGTTLAIARAQGKRAVGFEMRESQCEAIAKRLAQRELFSAQCSS